MYRTRFLIGGFFAVGLVLLFRWRALVDAWHLRLIPSFIGLRDAIAGLRDAIAGLRDAIAGLRDPEGPP